MTGDAMQRAAAVLRDAGSIVTTGHVGPDGDALGSAVALALAARLAGKEAIAAFGGDSVVPDTYSYLDLSPVVPAAEVPERPEVMVVFDTGVASRLGELAGPASAAGSLLVVDHHPNPEEGFGDVQVIDVAAGAAALLCTRLIDAAGWPLDERVGACLMTGIVTDTGRFQYSSTDGEILRAAARLVDLGVRPEVIGQAVYESAPFGYLQVSSRVLGRAVLEEAPGLVWSVVEKADLEAAGVGYESLDPLIDDLRIAREAGVAVLLKEVDGGYKASLRSRGAVDVGAIAAAEGGGGHHNAAGFTSAGTVEDIVGRIRARLRG
ncbi:MAG: DHH family phosphoesterase [Actinobacteria bacterium]|nr:DHH family phosphoesterase [Actinomycetota bacterium]